MANAWSNWSGFVTASPKSIPTPADVGELAELVRSAPGPLRVVGAGHSFTPLVQSDGTIVSLEKIEGLISHDAVNNRARVRAGTRLGALMHILQDIGQGLPNMGDIDKQAIGGSLGTATHGSGPTLGAYHTQLEAVQLVDGQGKLREYSRASDQNMIHATGVALGSFGVLTEVTMNNMPTYRLRRRKWVLPIGDMLKNFETMMGAHRSAEFYYIPFSGYAQFIASDLSDAAPTPRPTENDEEGLATLRKLRTVLRWLPSLRRALIKGAVKKVPSEDYV
ncbi:FAD-binding protein, partial [Mesorhizobium sp. M2D.F.Ca.ET.223.01.1.1]|uniref:FAD-binding protein n=1 Tax=Mesorhizobium sp. M2D.F.Ca.ET.223.01.1.1 TaxID=2563940 RepID=UPI001091D2FD